MVGTQITKILKVLNDKRYYEEEELAWKNINISNWHSLSATTPMKEGTHVQRKREGKEILWRACVPIFFLSNILTQTTHHVRSGLGGLNVEAHFFLPTSDKAQTPDFTLRARSKFGPVICGNRKTKGSGFRPLTKPKDQAGPLTPNPHLMS